ALRIMSTIGSCILFSLFLRLHLTSLRTLIGPVVVPAKRATLYLGPFAIRLRLEFHRRARLGDFGQNSLKLIAPPLLLGKLRAQIFDFAFEVRAVGKEGFEPVHRVRLPFQLGGILARPPFCFLTSCCHVNRSLSFGVATAIFCWYCSSAVCLRGASIDLTPYRIVSPQSCSSLAVLKSVFSTSSRFFGSRNSSGIELSAATHSTEISSASSY